jgi:hypothetical protein
MLQVALAGKDLGVEEVGFAAVLVRHGHAVGQLVESAPGEQPFSGKPFAGQQGGRTPRVGRQIGHQPAVRSGGRGLRGRLAGGGLPRLQDRRFDDGHHGFAHRRMAGKDRLDLAELDAEAADLDLVVAAAQVVDGAVGQVARQVAGAIEARSRFSGRREGVGHELLGREVGPSQVAARELHAADVELRGHADGHLPSLAVEQVDASIGHRPANGHQPPRARRITGPEGDVDRRFGRAVQVVQWRGKGGMEPLLEVPGEGFAAGDHPPHAAQVRRRRRRGGGRELRLCGGFRKRRLGGAVGQEGAQHGRHEMQGGDAVGGDSLAQVGAVAVAAGAGHHQTRAGEQRPEQLPHRDVEAEGSLLQHPVAGAEPILGLHPEQPVDDAAMGVHRPLGLAGRARGIDHVGEVVGSGGPRRARKVRQVRRIVKIRLCTVLRLQPGRRRIVEAERSRRRSAERRREAALGQQHRGGGVGEHEAQAVERVVGIERQVGAAGLEDGEDADHHGGGTLDADRHHGFGPDAEAAQAMGQAVGARAQGAEGEALAAVGDHRQGAGGAARLLGDELVQAAVLRSRGVAGSRLAEVAGGVVPLQELVAFGAAQPGQVGDGGERVAGGAGKQNQIVERQALDGDGVEEVAAVLERQGDPGGRLDRVQREVELGGGGLELAEIHRQRRLRGRPGPPAGRVLQHHRHLEQRRRREVALRRQDLHQLVEWQVLVGVGGQADLPHPLHQLAEARPAGEVGAQREGVDEAADQPLDLQPLAVGDRRAHHQVFLARGAMEQHVERREQGHEQRRAAPLRAAAQLRRQRGGHQHGGARAAEAQRRRPRPVGRQLETGRSTGQGPPPKGQVRLEHLAAQPGALPAREIGVLHRQLGKRRERAGAPGERRIERRQLTQEDPHRPAVRDDVVQHQDEQVLVRVQAQEGDAHERPAGEVERPLAEAGAQAAAGRRGCRTQPRQVDQRQGQR